MHNFENMPTPTPQTKRLGVDLNVDMDFNKAKSRDDIGSIGSLSPPQTPPSPQQMSSRDHNIPSSNNRALNPRNETRQTFLDDITPVDPSSKENDPDSLRGNRDSHDLSLSPRAVTRDSLVDHMLLSLDQFSFGQEDFGLRNPTLDEDRSYSAYGDDDPYQSIQNFAARSGRGHAYSYSSDYDAADDSSRYSDQPPSRSRRSNSSSNFQTGLSRINSIRNDMRGPTIPPRGLYSRAKGSSHGSKASSANSFDLGYAQVTGSHRWAHNLGRRSSSFDYGSDRQTAAQARQMSITIPPHSSYDYDAAPTPTVPGGPRRPRPASPILVSRPDASGDPPMEKLERKRSAKSSKSAYKGRGHTAPGRADYGLNDRSRELPPMPAFIKDAAPPPSVAYSKLEKNAQAVAQPPKEKPGFFRRVFGSSKNNSAVVPDLPHSYGSTMVTETADHPASKTHHIGNQVKSHHAAPSRDITPASKEHPHVLTKKPSSFFRRRKKSVSEADLLPVPAMPTIKLQPKDDLRQDIRPDLRPDITSEISPVSSLRQVMNPYLHSPGRPPIEAHQPTATLDHHVNDNGDDSEGYVGGFSPKYEPNKNATIRTIKPSSSHAPETRKATYSLIPQPRRSMSANFANPTGLDGQAKEDRDTSLQDSSDRSIKNDRDTNSRLTATKDVPGNTLLPSPISPGPSASVMRDMALVAEYERIHSKRSPTSSTFPAKIEPPLESPQSTADSKASQERATSSGKEEDWILLRSSSRNSNVLPEKENRIWLEPSSSEEDLPSLNTLKPRHSHSISASASTDTVYKSATSLPIVQVEGQEEGPPSSPPAEVIERALGIPSPEKIDMTPTEDDRIRAQKVFDGNEDFIQKEKAAAWMGDEDPVRSRTLIAYMELYNFTNLNILASLRVICGRLVLKGESQQVDRILDAFSKRWCQSNPNHGFKSTDVVHTICYSVLLLNTDLHLADIEQKMTRSQFVKNTMPTIRRCVTESAHEFEPSRPTVLPGKSSAFEDPNANDDNADAVSIEVEKHSWRQSFKPAPRPDPENPNAPTPLDYDTPVDDCGPLVKAPFRGTLRTWEVQVEIVLKDFYNSIRNERLPLFGAVDRPQIPAASTSTLSVFANGMLRRSPSVLSKAPSESPSYLRGRTAETVRSNGKWSNKTRSRPRLYPNSGLGSSRTSLDDQSSMWSPSVASSTWSKYSLGKTQTSMSVTSFDSALQGDYQQSIGFANALSQAIIREETVGSLGSHSDHGELQVASLLEDESLELHGAPWAKEGLVKHKHHLEALDKKAKDRNWNDTFAVIEKGYMSLFSFSTKNVRHKTKGKSSGGVVGGGNWQENAENLGSFLLRQTIASALPHPGYSKARPHVWALSLPTGAVHLFQVGTPDIVNEFVSTANYWSARLSNHPLVGGISNIEYGWSDEIVNNALVTAINESNVRPSTGGGRASMQSSLRSSMDHAYSGGVKARLPGDKILISDWSPPIQNMRSSNLMETDQLRTLIAYVQSIEEELQKHNMLRNPMLLAYSPRHQNAQKAMANWENKSSYLLREIVKFTTYIDSLHMAETLKQKIYKEREAHKAVAERVEDEGEGVGEKEVVEVES